MELKKYRLYCNTEAANVETDYREEAPTVCPNNNEHSINSESIVAIGTVTDEDPRDSSNKMRIHETSRPLGLETYFTGQADDISDITKKGGGDDFIIEHIADISITHVSRASNIATIKCDKETKLRVGDIVVIDCADNAYDVETAVVLSMPGTTSFTVSNTGDDESEKSSSGSVFIWKQHCYLDFNIIENETWIHEGYIIWRDAEFDSITLEMVPILTPYSAGENTYYNLYGGYLIVPAAGDGTIQPTNDMTDPRDGLIYIPDTDLGVPPVAYWDADWNSTSKAFENIAANAQAQGRYNMFTSEIVFGRFVNHVHLLGWGFEMLQSADTARIGQGMRLKATAETHGEDHAWKVSCALTMHREDTC